MPKKYPIRLPQEERQQLETFLAGGKASVRSVTHARILLKADEGEHGPAWKNAAIAEALEVSELTVTRVRKRYLERGLEGAVHRKERATGPAPRLDGAQEARLFALACSAPPTGRDRWSLRLLAAKAVELGYASELSHETVRKTLKRGRSSPG